MGIINPAMRSHEEQERMRAEDPKEIKKGISDIGAKLDDILGKENYVIDRDGKITPTRKASVGPKEESAVKELEPSLRQLYADLKRVSERT